MCALLGTLGACETSRNPGGVQRDLISPTIQLAGADTQDIKNGLNFSVTATDNLGLKDIQLTYSGGYINQTDSVFTSTVTSITLQEKINPGSGAGGRIRIIGRATDGAGNFSVDTLFIFLQNIDALRVYLLQPTPGAVGSPGKYIPIHVAGAQKAGVKRIGWSVGGAAGQTTQTGDSLVSGSPPFPDTLDFVDSVLVSPAATGGFFTVVGFAVDSGNRVGQTSPITVTLQTVQNDQTPPQIEQTVLFRAEANDTITVHATDPSGITDIGFRVYDLAGTLMRQASVVLSGTSTDAVKRFALGLTTLTPIPQQVVIQAFACDGATAHNCGVAGQTFTVPSPTGPSRADTITIVAGTTVALPFGGKIVDAIYNANRRELYLTNPTLGRVEIFQAANSTFVAAGIPTAGAQPWGVALWPRDTLGAYGDTIVVANSGGTQLAIIDVSPGARVLRWRQDLPDYLIQTYKVQCAPGCKTIITEYNISDRPQYVATVCRPAGGTLCAQDSIYAIYSTTPEPSNPAPFTGRATLRMEKLINPGNPPNPAVLFGHLFWEIAGSAPSSTSDTLRVVERRGRPYNTSRVTLTACAGINVELQSFALGDTTFVRNSGNFTHGFMGEGGQVAAKFARVMSYTTKARLQTGFSLACTTGGTIRDSGLVDVDFGMSPAVEVLDFISNTATRVKAIATNFNGATNAARADSVYYLDEGLRLKGTSPDTGFATGMDMNYNHTFAPSGSCPPTAPACGGSGSPNDRLLFVARFDANIDVFDTYFGAQVGTISIRDPIVGPLRVAKDASGNQLLFGITSRGVVMVSLPAFTNPLPAPPRR
ncbi:MAG: hypothetical protein DMD51_07260 [Gemmatimonadetes bacterium]|nr:MAG: hypothetical protein DMD51_07260 [Gemmatimonadota bacterium]